MRYVSTCNVPVLYRTRNKRMHHHLRLTKLTNNESARPSTTVLSPLAMVNCVGKADYFLNGFAQFTNLAY